MTRGPETSSAVLSVAVKPLGAIVSVFLLNFLINVFYNLFLHPLSSYPGPLVNRCSQIPWIISTIRGKAAPTIASLHEQYGPVVRISPSELVFSDGAAAKDIYMRQGKGSAGKLMSKSPVYYNAPPGGKPHSILGVRDEGDHARFRRLLSHAFSEKALRDQEPLIKTYIDLLITRLRTKSRDGPQDLVSWYNFVSFDIIGDLALGQSFSCLESSTLHPWVSFLFNNFKAACFIASARRFPLLTKIIMKIMPQKAVRQRIQHQEFTRERVHQRMNAETDRKDFMSNILAHNDKETGMTEQEIVSTFGILLLAGSETTATLLSVVTYHLLKNPDILEKLVNEIRGSFKSEDEITMVSVNGLKYQLAVLEEALRIHAPTPLGSPRTVPDGGEVIRGSWVPSGTTVFVCTYSANRQPSYWKNPDVFVPERWLGDPEYANDDKSVFAPFSLGTRNCIGRNLAYAEMRVILARILWNFDLELMEQSSSWGDNMKMFLLWEKPELFVKLTPVV